MLGAVHGELDGGLGMADVDSGYVGSVGGRGMGIPHLARLNAVYAYGYWKDGML